LYKFFNIQRTSTTSGNYTKEICCTINTSLLVSAVRHEISVAEDKYSRRRSSAVRTEY
jgi:hypothetical protein